MNVAKIITKYYLSIILLLLSLFPMYVNTHFNDIFSKNTIIAHPETGLFLSYVGLYTPSETIIHNSAIFPMTTATCYFLPLSAAEKIPSCNITSKRYKRFLDALIALGSVTVSLGISKSNNMQQKNLHRQMALVEKSLSGFSETIQIHGARLAKLESNQIILIEELQVTQQVLNAMLPLLNLHSEALNTLKIGIERLHNQFQHSSLYLAISQIFRNELTLNFLSPEDLKKVVYDVIHQGNITFNSHLGSVPIVQIITKLLVRQQIDFIPRSRYTTQNSEEIGRLVITNFFAVAQQKQIPFQIYKLLAVPFVHNNETIQLAHIPRYWAINPADNTTMEWYDSEESGCDLQLMSCCRDTPPLQKLSHDTCLGQIMNICPLSRCQATVAPLSIFFLRQLRDNFWVSSSSESLHCLRTPTNEYLNTAEQTLNVSEHVSLPPVALVNVTPGYTIACPGFTLIGRPIVSNASSLIIVYNNSVITNNISIVDVHRYLIENTAWFNRKPIKLGTDGVISRVHPSTQDHDLQTSHSIHIWFLVMLILGCICFGVTSSAIYYIYRRQQRDNLQNLLFLLPSQSSIKFSKHKNEFKKDRNNVTFYSE
jgi:hypothetical protein